MKSIHIRDIEDSELEALKRLAERHNRSLQRELHVILHKASLMAPPREISDGFRLPYTVNIGGESDWSREEIYGDEGR